jgi:hypothetical protein
LAINGYQFTIGGLYRLHLQFEIGFANLKFGFWDLDFVVWNLVLMVLAGKLIFKNILNYLSGNILL